MDFDMDLAVAQDSENPVYYVQYAHARICSILKKLAEDGIVFEGADKADLTLLTGARGKGTDPSYRRLSRRNHFRGQKL